MSISAAIWLPAKASSSSDGDIQRETRITAQVLQQQPKVTVELDIFSGRPNPSWELTGPRAEALQQSLRRVRTSGEQSTAVEPPGLGYRGFTLKVPSDGDVSTWRVFQGRLETGGLFWIDPDRAIESGLLGSVPADVKRELGPLLPEPFR